MAFYRGRIGADLNKPAFGVEDVFDPTNNNGSPYYVLTSAFGWDPYRLPTYDLQELITDYGITNQSYFQSYPADYDEVDDDFGGVDRTFGNTDASYYTVAEAEGQYLYDSTTPPTFTVTSPYTHTTPTVTTTRDVGEERSYTATANSHLVTEYVIGNQPSDTVSTGAMGADVQIINDYTLAYRDTRTAVVIANGSSTQFHINESSVNNYAYSHQDDEYGSSLFLNTAVSAKCVGINVTVYNAITNQVMSRNTTMPSTRSADGGFVWNTAEQAIWGGNHLIGVTTTSGLAFQSGTRIEFEFYIHTYKDRGANLDITNLYDITLNSGSAGSNPSIQISKKSNPGNNKGAPMGSAVSATVIWPYALYTFNVNTSNHKPKAWTNILGYSWIEDSHAYKSAQYPIKTVNVVIRDSNGNISPVGYNITRPALDGVHGYRNGITSASDNVDPSVIVQFTNDQLSPGMTIDLEVEYDILIDNNAGVDWSSYFDAYVSDISGDVPKLRVLGKGTSAGQQLGIDAGVGVPHGMNINVSFYRVNAFTSSGHGVQQVVNAGHDPLSFGYSLGNTVPTYGCYQIDVVVKDQNGQNVTSQCTVTRPPLDVYGYYDASQGIIVLKNDGSVIAYNWTVEVTERYQTYTDIGANQDITADYTWTEEYIDSSNPELGVYLIVRKNGTQVGPPDNLYMRTRYFWDLDAGGLPIVVLLNQNFYR